jgi:DNA-binding response OmpR family regulator
VLLDVSLPGLDGWRVLERIRAVSDTPVLMVTARGSESDRLRGLGDGADDYLTKPFGFPELIARIEVALRRSSAAGRTGTGDAGPPIRRHGDIVVDLAGHRVVVGRREVHLSPTEFRLLACLVQRAGVVVPHDDLLADVWGPGYERDHHLLQVTVRSLRAKLLRVDERPRVVSVYGVGYRLLG